MTMAEAVTVIVALSGELTASLHERQKRQESRFGSADS
jgi:hypothetical protein